MKFKLTAVAAIFASMSVAAAEPTNQELLDLIKKQQAQIEQLSKKVEKTDSKVESTVEAIETTLTEKSSNKSNLGGYGELHYNNIDGSTKKIDFHRFVMLL